MTYGVLSSTLFMMSLMLNISGIFSMMSSTIVFTFSSLVVVWPLPPPDSLGWSSKTVRKSFSEVVVRNPISALGCKPESESF